MKTQQRIVEIHGREYQYVLRRSKRAKRILLHIDVYNRIEVVVPWCVAYRQAEMFVQTKRMWIARVLEKHDRLQEAIPDRSLLDGQRLVCCGGEYVLRVNIGVGRKRSSVCERDGVVYVSVVHEDNVRDALERWYRNEGRVYFTACVRAFGVRVRSIRITGARTQWGSCGYKKRSLSFCWRLVLAPEMVIQYVVAHEVAHLKHPNHSAAFWREVCVLDPLYIKHQQWLKKYGYTLVL